MNPLTQQFPILNRKINTHPLIYLDNAATTQKPQAVLDTISNYYKKHNANIHRGIHTLSNEATQMWLDAHKKVAEFINAKSYEEIVFTRNATEALNIIALSYGMQKLQEGDVIVVSEMEHHSNIVPWQLLSKNKGIRIEWLPVNDDHKIDVEYLDFLIRKHPKKIKIVSVVHTSNVLGTTNDVNELCEMAHSVDAIFVLDACQSIAHTKIDVKALKCDFMVFSGHKLYGPTGSGVLYGRKTLLESLDPVYGGGEMIKSVSKSNVTWNDLPWKFEAGTPNIAGGIGLGAAIDWVEKYVFREKPSESTDVDNDGVSPLARAENSMDFDPLVHESKLISQLVHELRSIPEIKFFGPSDPKELTSLVSFTVKNIHSHDIAGFLDEKGIAIRAGQHCAHPLHEKYDVDNSARVSIAAYNTEEDIEILIRELKNAISMLK